MLLRALHDNFDCEGRFYPQSNISECGEETADGQLWSFVSFR